MQNDIKITKLDHLGLIKGMIDELGIIKYIDSVIPTDPQEKVTCGECIAVLIINALGFVSQPLHLIPEYLKDIDLYTLFNKDMSPQDFNIYKLSREIDNIYKYGTSKLFNEIGLSTAEQENLDLTCKSLDTTSFSVTGDYDRENDEQAVTITYGHSKDHRPDLKQILLELISTQDGGIPLMMSCHSGNKSDITIFRDRMEMLVELIEEKPELKEQITVADSKLYNEKTSCFLDKLSYITRISSNIKECQNAIINALKVDTWIEHTEKEKYQLVEISHNNIAQRWCVIYSEDAHGRAIKKINKAVDKEEEKIEKLNKQLSKYEFNCENDIDNYINQNKFKYFNLINKDITKSKDNKYKVSLHYTKEKELVLSAIEQRSCYVIGTNVSAERLTAVEVIAKYKNQNATIEHAGFKFLKDPTFFTQSFFVHKSERMEVLVTIMSLSLLVYSVAQRRVRIELEKLNVTVLNQLKKPTQKPTIKWLFKVLSGISIIVLSLGETNKRLISGLSDQQGKIIALFGKSISKYYCQHEAMSSSTVYGALSKKCA